MHDGRQVKDVFGEAVAAMDQTIRTFNEQARQLAERMVAQGRLSRAEGRRLVGELNAQVRTRALTFENALSGHVDTLRRRIEARTPKNLKLASKGQIREFRRQIVRLSAEVEKVSGLSRVRHKGAERHH